MRAAKLCLLPFRAGTTKKKNWVRAAKLLCASLQSRYYKKNKNWVRVARLLSARDGGTSVCGLKVLVYAALRY